MIGEKRNTHPGKALKLVLEDKGYSQKEFAKAVGLSPAYISDVIRGRRRFSNDACFRFARELGDEVYFWFAQQQNYEFQQYLIDVEMRDDLYPE
jgi:addiction module HigA family antidote